jgi:hypothetical protein
MKLPHDIPAQDLHPRGMFTVRLTRKTSLSNVDRAGASTHG